METRAASGSRLRSALSVVSAGPHDVELSSAATSSTESIVNDRVPNSAGALLPLELRSLYAIHPATAERLGGDLSDNVTYDERMAARSMGYKVSSPS